MKKVISIILLCVMALCFSGCFENLEEVNFKKFNKVAGTYREQYLEITLNNDNTFLYYNGVSNSRSSGTYTYREISDEKAEVSLTVLNNGSCIYDGGVVYFDLYGRCLFVPTINGSEVVARAMDRI